MFHQEALDLLVLEELRLGGDLAFAPPLTPHFARSVNASKRRFSATFGAYLAVISSGGEPVGRESAH
ncbi:hypothetical protein AB0L49_08970 [Streptomyces antimycoticus]|uniref:hypothetical protein n=1 Tax=Streptomyces antimycoticus TaxID=68175 RepID=UPI003417485A